MAVAFLIEIPGVTNDQIEAQIAAMGVREDPAAGSIVHMHGPMEGGVRVLDVWESQEAADAFYTSERFRQATDNPSGAIQPNITTWMVTQVSTGPAMT